MSLQHAFLDEAEIAQMAARWGTPIRQDIMLNVEPEFWYSWEEGKWQQRRGEVMFLLPRPGGLLLHRKPDYPKDGWRLLTGGIELGEGVDEAIAREPVEEVGLALGVRRYVAIVSYEIRCEGASYPWATHIFLLPYSDEALQPSHDDEIEETMVVPLTRMNAVADKLERLASPWRDWGRFRAVAHRIVQRYVKPEEIAKP